ncbi:putative abc multidrug [Phaeomoniella chlamydospora]|uniref:Putative abc multidrug n=1 Tax=Phaeomoniella chlamydospora TaxID=158046 RepID=A0A0G2FWW3_PHACM|nr:putative abc multidrug [Phaeomoniella chlamydospora]
MSRSLAYQQYIFGSTRLIVRIKISFVQLINDIASRSLLFSELPAELVALEKERADEAIAEHEDNEASRAEENKTANERSGKSPVGRVLNLTSYDVDGITGSRDFVFICSAAPVELTLGILFLYKMLGWVAFVGLGLMILSIPIPSFLSRRMAQAQRGVMSATDSRISLISEYLSSIRIIKYFAWEPYMIGRVTEARATEQRLIWKRLTYSIAIMIFSDFVPLFSLFIMFIFYTTVRGLDLTSSIGFTSMTVVEILRQQFVWASMITRFVAQMTVACGRLDNFFKSAIEIKRPDPGPAAFNNATIRRTPTSSFKLQSIDVTFTENALNVIVGPSGSGKTTLLLALLGEAILETGSVTCPRDVGYASQTAWLQNLSIRDNILFYSDYNPERYQRVVDACCLLPDFDDLEHGDSTEVGENGTALSGGQRQRVAVARAIYSPCSLLLLDDIFSALDAPTAERLFHRCFTTDLLADRTLILVTQAQWIAAKAQTAVYMDGGKIEHIRRQSPGSRAQASPLRLPPVGPTPANGVPEENCSGAMKVQKNGPTKSRVTVENIIAGRIPRSLFYQYMVLFGGHRFAIATIAACALTQFCFFSITLWLSVWVGAYNQHQAVNVGFYIGIYACIMGSFHVMSALNQLSFQRGGWQAAKAMHWKLINSVMSAPLSWLDANPVGRIINRFSTDIYSLDSDLIDYLRMTMDNAFRLALRIVGIGSIMPIFAIPAAFVCLIGYIVGEMYTRAQLSLKQLHSASQSPVFAHISVSLSGQSVIRARAGVADRFQQILAMKLRDFARAAEARFNCNRWVCVRADCATATVSLCAGLIAISRAGSVSASLVGFSLSNAIGLSSTILTLVRSMNDLEVELNCFRRAQEYSSLEPERSVSGVEDDQGLCSSWPSTGNVEFQNFSARYAEDSPDVVSDVSFSVKAGQRVAIIGRTGSGKTTLALSMLSLTHISHGRILIDGVDIRDITLHRLRSSLTIIPQDPILFSGDLQYNLDPSQTLAKHENVISALLACQKVKALSKAPSSASLSSIASSAANGHVTAGTQPFKQSIPHITLQTQISEKGENFSPGQRQVLGLARAIARRSKVVILDEATASVDDETDATIQELLRKEFKGSTLIAIAHRLKSVVDYDMIIVMGGGKMLETGSPKALFDKRGVFFDMLRHTGDFDHLAGIIQGNSS